MVRDNALYSIQYFDTDARMAGRIYPIPLFPRGCLPEQVEMDDPVVELATQVYLEKRPLNGSISSSSQKLQRV